MNPAPLALAPSNDGPALTSGGLDSSLRKAGRAAAVGSAAAAILGVAVSPWLHWRGALVLGCVALGVALCGAVLLGMLALRRPANHAAATATSVRLLLVAPPLTVVAAGWLLVGGRAVAANVVGPWALAAIASLLVVGAALRHVALSVEERLGSLGVGLNLAPATAARRGGPSEVVPRDDGLDGLREAISQLHYRVEDELFQHAATVARASEADRLTSGFLGLAGAEMRAALDTIASAATVAAATMKDLPEQLTDVELIRGGAAELRALVDEVIDARDPGSNAVHLKVREVDVAQLVTEVARTQRPLLARKSVRLVVDAEPARGPFVIHADRQRIRQILFNLVGNALKFTEDGEIRVRLARRDGLLEVAVSDQGPGIAPEALSKLFQEFEQTGAAEQRARGTGLGLAISRRLVEAHGGSISATSTPGRGATFLFTLPADGRAGAAATTTTTPPTPTTNSPPTSAPEPDGHAG